MNELRIFILAITSVIISASAVLAQSSITPGDPGNFITTWNTENSGFSADNQITIPHANGETYNFTLYWEDTTDPLVNGTETFTTPFFTVTFPDPGIYRVEITGDFPRIFFAGTGDRRKILSVEQWGDIEWSSMDNAFRRASNLEINATDAPDLSNVLSMGRMFESATSLNSDLNNWDVSNVEDMNSLFDGATSFNGNISSWNVSSVTNMAEMFNNAREFNQDIGGWNTSSVTGNGMIQMFQNARAFNQDISDWDVSGITNMRRMFNGAIVFNQDIGYDEGTGQGWDVSNVTTMSGMFQNAERFNSDIGGWGVSSVTDMGAMFNNVEDFNQDLNGWDVSNVTSMASMFQNSPSFNGNISDWDTDGVTSMNGMFSGASAFNQDISGWNTENVSSMYQMFFNASSFDQNIGNWNVEGVANPNTMNNMFDNTALSRPNYDGILTGWAPQNVNTGVTLGADGLEYCAESARTILIDKGWTIEDDVLAASCPVVTDPFTTTWNTSNSGDSNSDQIRIPLFGNGYDFTVDWGDGTDDTYTLNPGVNTEHYVEHTYSGPGTYTVEIRGDFPRIYFNNSGDKEKILSVESWGEVEWGEMEFAFYGASNLEINALDAPDLTNVTSLYAMFQDAASMNSSLNQWDVSGIENMANMFYGASSFNQNLIDWETGNVEKMASMFRDASDFDRDIGMWDIPNVILMENMLDGSGMSVENYDAILSGWAAQTVQNNIVFGADGLQYCFSEADRQTLTSAPNSWTINGDSVAAGCSITSMDPFITLWETDDTNIEIPTTGSGYNYAVYWEKEDDNTVNGTLLANTGDLTISLPQPGVYRVEIYEDFPRIHFASFGYPVSAKEELLSVEQWGEIEWESMAFAFFGAVNLEINATDEPDLNDATSLEGMFGEALKVNGGLENWDVSNIQTMRRMFQGRFDAPSAFNGDISNWNVDNVTDMQQMFQHATSFNRDISGWDVSKVENMAMMFERAENFDQDIGYDPVTEMGWDVSKVTDMGGMFFGATAFNRDIGGWDVSSVKNFGASDGFPAGGMFEDAVNFNQDLSNWDITAVTGQFGENMFQMFDNSGLSRENYDALLIAWSDLMDASGGGSSGPSLGGISLGVTGLTYCAVSARNNLIDSHNWSFDGDVLAGDCVSSQVVSATNSEVTATTPHTADGTDQSTVTVVLRDEEDDPITGFTDGDFSIELTGSASVSEITETGTAGTYSFTVTDAVAEIVTVTVTAGGVELDNKPTIDFEAPPQAVSASNSEITATTPHTADGVDQSTVTIVLRDEEDDPITGFVDGDFSIEVTGSAASSEVTETGTAGTYSFTVTDAVAEIVTVTVTAGGVELDDEPTIDFAAPPQVVSATNSEVIATTPHTADGVDQSTVTVVLRDEEDDPITGFTDSDFSIELTGSASDSEITETGTAGTYSFTVTDAVAEIVTVTVTAGGVELDNKPTIDFEAPPQVVSASNSDVTATTPHTADGTDQSTVTVILRDEEDDPISGYVAGDFLIELTGSADETEITETGTVGTYSFTVTDAVAEIVTVTVTAGGVELDDESTIDFEAPPQVVSASNSDVTATTPHTADGVDQSTVTVVLRDEEDDPISGYVAGDFLIELTGSADGTEITETGTVGTYSFNVTDTVEEIVTVTITANGTELDDQPTIDFEAPVQVVDATDSEVTATTPHVADGVDKSIVTVILKDEENDPIGGYTSADFSIEPSGSATAGEIAETGAAGTYTFSVANTVPETVTVIVKAGGTELNDQPTIIFEAPEQTVNSENSEVTATSPHVADGLDESIVTVILRDDTNAPVTEFTDTNFLIELTGSATASEITETETAGTYRFIVTDLVAETVLVTVTTGGAVLEDQPEIVFEPKEIIIDPEESEVIATSPHIANGTDESIVTVLLQDVDGEPVPGLTNDDFEISLKGSGEQSGIEEGEKPGFYTFTITNVVEEVVVIAVTVNEVVLEDQPKILFEAPEIIISPVFSEVTASSPHIADGEDAAAVTIIVRDENKMAVSGLLPKDFSIEIKGKAEKSEITGTEKEGVYSFSVLSKEAGSNVVSIGVQGVLLDQQAEILFEDPIQIVDAFNSEVSATSPHLADGEDASIVTVILRDEENEEISGKPSSEFDIQLTGIGTASSVAETDPGVYIFGVVSNTAGEVKVFVTVSGVELGEYPVIVFEKAPDPVPDPPSIVSISDEESGVEVSWVMDDEAFIVSYNIYKGASVQELAIAAQAPAGTDRFTDSNPEGPVVYYAVSAVNSDGVEGNRSAAASYLNSSITASQSEWSLVSVSLSNSVSNHQNTTLYGFSNQYELSSELVPSHGYWIKSNTFDPEFLQVSGAGLDSSAVNLQAGWNLIGSLASPFLVSDISDPQGILTNAPVFGFFESGYQPVNQLEPNRGYWIFADEAGTVELNTNKTENQAASSLIINNVTQDYKEPKSRIEFHSGSQAQILWVSDEPLHSRDAFRYLLPPAAPATALDVRTNRGANIINQPKEQILIQAAEYPVQVSVHGVDSDSEYVWRLILQNSNEEQILDLFPGKTALISKPYDRIEVLKVHVDDIITEHKILPNYPNPFNPSTTLRYQVREQTHVSIEVYDAVGRRVQVLRNEMQTSGTYSILFNAAHLSSGLYFVRFMAGSELQIQKMTLIK